ncbi:MAG: type II toxin-antitoxin system ParD family antitoxin [Patescibacteria group bacterium]
MSTLSVPLSIREQEFIDSYVKSGQAENKAQVVRRALRFFEEEEAVQSILRAEQELKAGKVMYGDLRELIKKI